MKIAIVKLSALGDIVHAMVALQFIKQHYPAIEIDWVVEERFAELLRHNPHLHAVHSVNLKALKQNKRLLGQEIARLKHYAKANYDYVIDAQGLLKSAVTAMLLGKQRIGFDKNSIRERLAACLYQQTVACPYDANSIDRNVCVLAGALGIHVTPQQILAKQPFLYFSAPIDNIQAWLHPQRRNILYVVGSTWPSRNYPPEQFLGIIEALKQQALILWGNTAEYQTATWLAERSSYATALPKMDLNTLKALIARVDLVIGNDTGPTHMAWGLNKPSITLFGPTPVSRVYQTSINKVLKSPSVVNPFKLNKNDYSIAEIPVEVVVELAQELLMNSEATLA